MMSIGYKPQLFINIRISNGTITSILEDETAIFTIQEDLDQV